MKKFILILLTFILLSSILAYLNTSKNIPNTTLITINKNLSNKSNLINELNLISISEEIYSEIKSYNPQNYKINSYKIKSFSIEFQIYSNKKLYKLYIYPEIKINTQLTIQTKILDYLKSVDNFLYTINKNNELSKKENLQIKETKNTTQFKEIHIFTPQKIYTK